MTDEAHPTRDEVQTWLAELTVQARNSNNTIIVLVAYLKALRTIEQFEREHKEESHD